MTPAPARTFTDSKAIRARTPLIIGLCGPSSSGKTMSALELASGIRRVVGGETYFIDTEAGRALAYADHYDFRHVPFGAPFGPLEYLAAIEHCVKRGATTVVIDSMSHEHEGPGGVLEMHEAEVKRKAGDDVDKAERVNLGAWAKPKAERQRLINTMVQLPCNVIICFRAKEKLKIVPGQQPIDLGWQAIAGDEFQYECALSCLLYPCSDGVPTWKPTKPGEKALVKLPRQFRELFDKAPRLSADVGEQLARWAAGAAVMSVSQLLEEYPKCSTTEARRALVKSVTLALRTATPEERAALKAADDAALARIAATPATPPAEPPKPPSPTGPCNDDGSVPGM